MRERFVAFLWHMHQPSYFDPEQGIYTLPWARLHGIKAYYDMASLLEHHPEIKATFNFAPSLLVQLKDYARGASDVFLEHTLRSAKELDPRERAFLLDNFFACPETMIRPHPRYVELLKKRAAYQDSSQAFSDQDLLDLQVWFNLAWFGFRAKELEPGIQELEAKGKGFTEEEKAFLIEAQRRILREVVPLYKKLQDEGRVEISISPFYHPILPLLYSTELARRARPDVALPPSFEAPEDVRVQIRKAVSYYREVFGISPQGLWPSEGSLCPELIPILAESGIKWTATDEALLFRSLPGLSKEGLYQPYRALFDDKEVAVIFRDRELSNLLSFTYAKEPTSQAVSDFVGRLGRIQAQKDPPLIAIILDGENPWPAFPDGGEAFLNLLYRSLTREPQLSTTTIGQFLKEHPPDRTIPRLATGSWIDGNFDIWIGQEEDNRGWAYLKKTREFLMRYLAEHPEIPRELADRAWEAIYVAEGSDWFWWYGDQFHTEQDVEFDRLFRAHLTQVFTLFRKEAPAFLKIPICGVADIQPAGQPTGFISPVLDGQVTHYFEWEGAGRYQAHQEKMRRYQGKGSLQEIRFGFDEGHLFLRLDPSEDLEEPEASKLSIRIHLLGPQEFQLLFPLRPPEGEPASFSLFLMEEGFRLRKLKEYGTIAIRKVLELSLPFQDLGLKEGMLVKLFVFVERDGREIDRYPRRSYLSFMVPGREFEQRMWSV